MDIHKADIRTEQDVELMVDSFYAKVNQDPLLSYVFNDFAEVDWQSHLPKMYQFWSTLIFGVQSYKGNPLPPMSPCLWIKPILKDGSVYLRRIWTNCLLGKLPSIPS